MKKIFFSLGIGYCVAIHSLARLRIQMEPVKTSVSKPPGILSRNGIDSNAKQPVRLSLKQLDEFVAHPHNFGQVLRIADSRHASFLLIGTQTGKVVLFLFDKTLEILLGLLGKRNLIQELLQLRLIYRVTKSALIAAGMQGICY